MAPRTITNPAPQTASARAALAAFHCALCGKGYARQNEFAAHEASYEHNHNQRRADLRRMNVAMSSAGRNSDADKESGPGGIIKIQLGTTPGKKDGTGGSGGKGFKKSGFRSIEGDGAVTEQPEDKPAEKTSEEATKQTGQEATEKTGQEAAEQGEEPDMDYDDGYELYDPEYPTDCAPGCPMHKPKK